MNIQGFDLRAARAPGRRASCFRRFIRITRARMVGLWEFSATLLVGSCNVQLLEIFAFVGNLFLSFFRFDDNESHSTLCLN